MRDDLPIRTRETVIVLRDSDRTSVAEAAAAVLARPIFDDPREPWEHTHKPRRFKRSQRR